VCLEFSVGPEAGEGQPAGCVVVELFHDVAPKVVGGTVGLSSCQAACVMGAWTGVQAGLFMEARLACACVRVCVPGCQGARVPGARVPGCQGARVPGCLLSSLIATRHVPRSMRGHLFEALAEAIHKACRLQQKPSKRHAGFSRSHPKGMQAWSRCWPGMSTVPEGAQAWRGLPCLPLRCHQKALSSAARGGLCVGPQPAVGAQPYRVCRPCLHVACRPCLNVVCRPCLNVVCQPCLNVACRPCLHVACRPCLHVACWLCLHVACRPCLNVVCRPCLNVARQACLHVVHRPCLHVASAANLGMSGMPQTGKGESTKEASSEMAFFPGPAMLGTGPGALIPHQPTSRRSALHLTLPEPHHCFHIPTGWMPQTLSNLKRHFGLCNGQPPKGQEPPHSHSVGGGEATTRLGGSSSHSGSIINGHGACISGSGSSNKDSTHDGAAAGTLHGCCATNGREAGSSSNGSNGAAGAVPYGPRRAAAEPDAEQQGNGYVGCRLLHQSPRGCLAFSPPHAVQSSVLAPPCGDGGDGGGQGGGRGSGGGCGCASGKIDVEGGCKGGAGPATGAAAPPTPAKDDAVLEDALARLLDMQVRAWLQAWACHMWQFCCALLSCAHIATHK